MGAYHAHHRFARLKIILILLAAAALLVGAYLLFQHIEDSQYVEPKGGTGASNPSWYRVKEVNGRRYVRKSGLNTVLLIGVDDTAEEVAEYFGYRNDSQADFLLLIVIDPTERAVHRLMINRNTMAEITILGVLGKETGTRVRQITLAHGFGLTEDDRSAYTVRAVQKLLAGEEIDYYASTLMESMQGLNRVVGGVEVTLEDDDLAVLDPTLVKGAHVTLTDEQAALLIRSRMKVGDGKNASRMNRQRVFLDGFVSTVKKRLLEDVSFVDTLAESVYGMMTTNANRATLNNLMSLAFSYDILPVETLTGEYRYGSDGFEEFYSDENAIISWVLDTFYEPQT